MLCLMFSLLSGNLTSLPPSLPPFLPPSLRSNTMRNTVMAVVGHMAAPESVASSSVKTAFDIDAKMIVVLTETGTTPRLIAKYRPSMPILALTAIPETARAVQVRLSLLPSLPLLRL